MEFNKDKIKFKIAISEIKEEDIGMKNEINGAFKTGIISLIGMILGTSVVFAGGKVIENIFKTPIKIENVTNEITKESKKKNITEEQAKNIAINKLNDINFNSNIIGIDHYKENDSDKIIYRFNTEDNYAISIDGKTGKFYEIWNNNKNIQNINLYISEEKAIEIANKYYKIFGYKNEEYEISDVQVVNYEGTQKGDGFSFNITYSKKYNDIYNPYESICIGVESKNENLSFLREENTKFDNNELVISKDEAINIVLDQDRKITKYNIENIKSELRIVKLNADSYDRSNNYNQHYEAMQIIDYPEENRNYYYTEDRIRFAWVVVLTYEDVFDDNIEKRYTEGKYSYFVDATTGEIIGGQTMDYFCNEGK